MQTRGRTLRIAFVSAALYHILPRLIRDLRDLEEPIDVELQEATTNEQVEILASGQIDLGLMHPPVASRHRSSSQTLTVDRFDAVLPADHPLAEQKA